MKILVLGAGGMAGHVVSTFLREKGYEVDTLSGRNKLDDKTYLVDVTDNSKLEAFLISNSYDVIVNCIGMLVKQSEERKDLAVYLNAYLPHQLEEHFKDTKTKIIHISSDGVFSGQNSPYIESSATDTTGWYGKTKALGEINNGKDLTFRMSIIGPDYRKDGSSLFNWFMGESGDVTGFSKVMWNGITTIELAKAIDAAIEQNLSGIFNLVPKNSISKFNLLKLIKKEFELDNVSLKKSEARVFDASISSKRKDFNYEIASYPQMIKELRDWVEEHPRLYKHYGI